MQDILDKDIGLIYYLLKEEQGEKTMGNIRIEQKCSKCGGVFKKIDKLGYICPVCKIKPTRFFLDLYCKGQRLRLFSDKQGQALDTYERAKNLLEHINYEIKNFCFNPDNYVKAEIEKYWTCNLVDKYIEYKKDSLAPSYQKDFLRMLRFAKDSFKTKDVREIRKIDIINYKEYLEKEFKLSNKSIKNFLDLFKTFLNYLKKDIEIISVVPGFPEIIIDEHQIKTLSADEQVKIMDLIPKEHQPLIAFLMLHGCRPGEARALRCKDINIKDEFITVRSTFSNGIYREKRKGRRSRAVTIPLHRESMEYIAERVKNNLPEAYIFINSITGSYYRETFLKNLWQRIRKEAGLGRMRLYDATRHSFGSILANDFGVSAYIASKLLGHSSTKTTEKYYLHSNIKSLKVNSDKLSLKNKVVAISKAVGGQ